MKNTAIRLATMADSNKIIHIDKVEHPSFRRLLLSDKTLPKIRISLRQIDPQMEILIPRKVDDDKLQLKRHIQYNFGTRVNLTSLRKNSYYYYNRLCQYGNPKEVLEELGLDVFYSTVNTDETVKERLEEFSENGVVSGLYSGDKALYMHIVYKSRSLGLSIGEYVESLGFKYLKE